MKKKRTKKAAKKKAKKKTAARKRKATKRPATRKRKTVRKKRNPDLLVVTNPRKKKRSAKKKAKRKRACKVRAAYKKLHGVESQKGEQFWLPDRIPKKWVTLGELHSVTYRPSNRSQMADRRASATLLTHRFGRSCRLVCSADGVVVLIVDTKRKGPRTRDAMKVSGLKGEDKLGIVG